jgi:hypothetical protein
MSIHAVICDVYFFSVYLQALAVLPFGEYVNGWVELPLPIDAKARLNTASSVSPEVRSKSCAAFHLRIRAHLIFFFQTFCKGAFVAGGQMTFDLTMTKWDNDIEPNSERPERLVPLVMVQEVSHPTHFNFHIAPEI